MSQLFWDTSHNGTGNSGWENISDSLDSYGLECVLGLIIRKGWGHVTVHASNQLKCESRNHAVNYVICKLPYDMTQDQQEFVAALWPPVPENTSLWEIVQ